MIVGRCLSPALSEEERTELAGVLKRGSVPWEHLLALANQHECTTLWYVRLGQYRLLDLLPEDLQDYLAQLHGANQARNAKLREELVNVVGILDREGIPVLLLKGATIFVDDLYGDTGARMMRDLDILLPEDRIDEARNLLRAEGYLDDPDDSRHAEPAPLSARHHHLPPLVHEETGIQIEPHFKVAYAHAGRVLTAEAAWQSAAQGKLDGQAVYWLSPTNRLLHNMLHATQPYGEFIRAELKLSDLAECAAIAARDGDRIHYGKIWPELREHKLLLELAVFAMLARKIMLADIQYPEKFLARLHECRLAVLNDLTTKENASRTNLWRKLAKVYYFFKMPGWVYRNACYGNKDTPVWLRMRFILQRLADPSSRKKAVHYGPN